MDNDDDLIIRMGTFFYILGSGAFILFIISDFADQADFDFFFVAVILLTIGWFLRRRKPPPPSAGRFEYINRKREEARNRRAARSKKPIEKKN